MTLVRLPSPFDGPDSAPAPATPTCCCCSCCLVSTVTSATLNAVHVHHVTAVVDRTGPARLLAVIGAALSTPLAVVLAIALVDGFDTPWAAALALVAYLGALIGLYLAAGADGPYAISRGLGVGILAAAAFVLELLSLGLLFYGQLLVLVIPPVAGVALYRNLRDRR